MCDLNQKIIDVVVQETGIDETKLNLDANLQSLGVDSLSALEILMILEDEFDIEIPQDRLNDVYSTGKIAAVISEQIKKKRQEKII